MRHLLIVLFLILPSCVSFVQVLDEHGKPMESARVATAYPSFTGPDSITDSEGRAVLRSGWIWLFSALHVRVRNPDGEYWTAPYPPPSVIRRGPVLKMH